MASHSSFCAYGLKNGYENYRPRHHVLFSRLSSAGFDIDTER